MTFKAQIVAQYEQRMQDKIDAFQDMISALSKDSKNDAKGSAGDKHETALSMMHIEQEKLNYKLRDHLNDSQQFSKTDFTKKNTKVQLGSLVLANANYFLIAVALPKITVQGANIFGISPQSPLAQELIGHEEGHSFEINSVEYVINEII
jgi:transcription elongation GreA/GreB family factor